MIVLRSWHPAPGLVFEVGRDATFPGLRWHLRVEGERQPFAYSNGAFYDNTHPDYPDAQEWALAATRAFWAKRGPQFTPDPERPSE
jgi:hypothetical protein